MLVCLFIYLLVIKIIGYQLISVTTNKLIICLNCLKNRWVFIRFGE